MAQMMTMVMILMMTATTTVNGDHDNELYDGIGCRGDMKFHDLLH